MRLLITGGAGYIGSVTAAMAVQQGHRVVVLDDLSTGFADSVPAGASLIVGDVAAPPDLTGFDAVIHFAAKALVEESMRLPGLYWRSNLGGSLSLLDAAVTYRVPRVVVSSSCAVYGAHDVPITEHSATHPINPYGASKLAVDVALAEYARLHGLAAVSLRYFNVAGSYAGHGERHAQETHLIPNLLSAAISGNPIKVFGNDYQTRDGTCIRDYVHVEDLARAHLQALNACRPFIHKIFNLGSGRGYSVLEAQRAVSQATDRDISVTICDRRPGDPPKLVANSSKARTGLGWVPYRSLHDMAQSAYRFSLSNLATKTGGRGT
jgi:UDP-glucose 4-epimerase